ncbi:2-dehydro-3-deoxygalactonokinase [Rouxiella sp. T17]|uniref:2-dehydro-3-deoxygalactonokinase n=1 Tax=Rouxiella sp. T17 TaxID=3085684 RepID=UPI002FC7BEE1
MTQGFIAIDWGSTHLRAWLYREGVCIDERRCESGIAHPAGKTSAEIFDTVTNGWQQEEFPVVMAGMVGSNLGLMPAAYLPCPTRLDELVHHLTQVKGNQWIVPGLSINHAGNCNVMRGEETQLLGAWKTRPAPFYIMPGTHCKWVAAEGGVIHDFRTVMTGELHNLLMNKSLIGAGLPQQHMDHEAFLAGAQKGLSGTGGLSRLFEVRASHVLGNMPKELVSEYLSGVLIGGEIAEMQALYGLQTLRDVTIIANPVLSQRYINVLEMADITSTFLEGDDAFLAGIRNIIHELG